MNRSVRKYFVLLLLALLPVQGFAVAWYSCVHQAAKHEHTAVAGGGHTSCHHEHEAVERPGDDLPSMPDDCRQVCNSAYFSLNPSAVSAWIQPNAPFDALPVRFISFIPDLPRQPPRPIFL